MANENENITMFKAKLTPDHPYVGYTLFSDTSTLFKDNDEYLARGDGKSISGNYAINLNGIYDSGFTDIDYSNGLYDRGVQVLHGTYNGSINVGRSVRDYLACAALAQSESGTGGGICDDGNFFYHYTVVDSSKAPYKTEITLPFSANSSSKTYYINYMAFGYSRSNTPYVGLGSFMTPGVMLDVSLNDQSYYYGNGDIIKEKEDTGVYGTPLPLYTYKGSGVWSTQLCNRLCHQYLVSALNDKGVINIPDVDCTVFNNIGYTDANDMITTLASGLETYLSSLANDIAYNNINATIGNLSEEIDKIIAEMNTFLTGHSDNNFDNTSRFFMVGCKNDITTNNKNKIVFYKLRIYFKDFDPGDVVHGSANFNVTATYNDPFDTNNDYTVTREYKVVYTEIFKESDPEYNQYNQKIFEYLLDTTSIGPELINTSFTNIIDESKSGFGIDVSTNKKSFNIMDGYTYGNMTYKIFPVIRLVGPYTATSAYLYNSIFGRKFVDSLGKVEKGKFNRFDAAVISGGRKSLQIGVTLNASGENAKPIGVVYSEHANNSFIPRREGSRGTHSISMLNQFRTPGDSSTAGGYNFGFLSYAESKPSGSIYVCTIRIKLAGDTREFANSIIIYGPNGDTTINLNNKEIGKYYSPDLPDSSLGYTTYEVKFTKNNSVSYISAAGDSITTQCMDVRFCGLQQMIRSCSANSNDNGDNGEYATKYSSIFSSDVRSKTSQWSAAKIFGYISFSVTGGNQYTAADGDVSNTVTIIGAEIEIADETNVVISTNKASLQEGKIDITETGYSLYDNRYALAVQNDEINRDTSIYSPFLYSMSGKMSDNIGEDNYLYEDTNTFNQTFTVETFPTLLPIDSSTLPGTQCGSYQNGFDSSYYTGLTFKNSTVIEADVSVASRTEDVFVSNSIKGISNYPIITTINESKSNSLTTEFNKKNEITCKLPIPGLLSKLIYESVEFNGASAWTFTRSMPLEPASKENPHVLLYRIETWIETEKEIDGVMVNTVEVETTKSMKFAADKTKIYSGSDIASMDFVTANVKNNIYLKYNDGVTTDFNAVATGLPFYILDEDSEQKPYCGGTRLDYDALLSNCTTIDNDLDDNFWNEFPSFDAATEDDYNKIYEKIHTKLNSIIQDEHVNNEVAVVGCSGSSEDIHLTLDKHKIMYIGVAFYNPREEMIPINMVFNVSYIVTTDSSIEQTYYLPHALSHFFPRDSMLYMAGKSYKQKTNDENANKIKFNRVKGSSSLLHVSTDEGAHIVQGTSKGGQDADGNNWSSSLDEVINIGEGSAPNLSNEEIQKLPTSEISASSARKKGDGLYGILNKYSGVVEYVATSNEVLSNSNGITTPESIEKYFTSVKGKCIKSYQNICFFPNRDANIKQWIL